MFWRFTYSSSQIQTLLERQDVTLKEILDEEDVLQECKSNNEKLINFLTEDENLSKLIDNVVIEPFSRLEPDHNDEESVISDPDFFKYPLVSCEVLICDQLHQIVNDKLISNGLLMDKLYGFLKYEYINPVLMSYYVKIIGSLITKKPQQFLDYIETKENEFLSLFVKHMSTSSIVDIIRLLITIDSSAMYLSNQQQLQQATPSTTEESRAIKWLKKIHLIHSLIDLFAQSAPISSRSVASVYCNVSQAICDLIRITREQILGVLYGAGGGLNLGGAMNTIDDCLGSGNTPVTFSMDGDDFAKEPSPISSQSLSKSASPSDITALIKNSILDDIESDETINKLLDYIFEPTKASDDETYRESPIVYIVEILLTILDSGSLIQNYFNQINENEQERAKREREKQEITQSGTRTVLRCCLNRVSSFNELLLKWARPKHEHIKLSNGETMKSLGLARLSVIKLIAKLISLNDAAFNNELIKAGTIKIILDMGLLEYKWNNFLHTQIVDIVKNCLNSDLKIYEASASNNATSSTGENQEAPTTTTTTTTSNTPSTNTNTTFIEHFLVYCNLIQNLIKTWNEYFASIDKLNENQITFQKPNQMGLIGHVTLLTNLFANKDQSSSPSLSTYIQENMNKFVPKDVLSEWEELNNTKVKIINVLNTKELVRNPNIVSALNDSFLAQHATFGAVPDDDEKMNRRFNELKQEIKISCVQEFGLAENNITTFTQDWTLNRPNKASSFFVSSNNESAQMFEQICQQRESMNFGGANAPSAQADDDDVWITKEIKFAKSSSETGAGDSSSFDQGKSDDMFGMYKKESSGGQHRREAMDSCSSSSSSSDDDDNDPFKMKPNKRHQQISIESRGGGDKTTSLMDGKDIDFGVMTGPSSSSSTTSGSIFSRNISGRSKPEAMTIQDEEFGFDTTAKTTTTTTTTNIPTSGEKKDILPIDTDPWADTSAASASSTTTSFTASDNNTPNLFPADNQEASKSDDQSWANFDNMT